MSGMSDLMRNIDYAVWLRSRGISNSAIAETFNTPCSITRKLVNERAKQKGITIPKPIDGRRD